ncbi:nuclear transport factor 2 family protein [Chitinophaga sp.]|uniref:nuclear transport factor 2 family protein n=1 Tax=Chitinophaga sp. TaxID=1869181 RepID=UPI0031CFF6E8
MPFDAFFSNQKQYLMNLDNKTILEKANAAITEGNNEAFLSFCTDDLVWTFVGDRILQGKEAVRQYMATVYVEPPKFTVENLIAEGEFVTAIGKISMRDENGRKVDYDYCDVWRFRNGRMAELRAFVIETGTK